MTVRAANLVRLDIDNLAIGATSATLSTPSEGSQLPDDLPYFITVYDRDTPDPLDQVALTEIIRVDAHNTGAGTLDTIKRGQHGTTDQNHTTGTPTLIIGPIAEQGPSSVFNIMEFGGNRFDSGPANDTAITDALAAIKLRGGGVLYIPFGSWSFDTQFSVDNISNIKIKGDGIGVTNLLFNDTNGIVIDNSDDSADPNRVKVWLEDFSITDVFGTANTTTGIHFKASIRNGGIKRVRVGNFGTHMLHVQGGEHLLFEEFSWVQDTASTTGDLILCEDGIGAGRIARHHTWIAGNTDRNESSGLAFHMKGIMGFQATGMEFYNGAGVFGRAILCENDGVEEFRGSFSGIHLRSGYTTRSDDFKFLNVYRPLVSDIIVDKDVPLTPEFIYDSAWSATLGFGDADKRHAVVIQGGVNPAGTGKPSAHIDQLLMHDVENVAGADGEAIILRVSQGQLLVRSEDDAQYRNVFAKQYWARVDGTGGGFLGGLDGDVHLYRESATNWRTPDGLTVDASLIVSGTSVLDAGLKHKLQIFDNTTISLGVFNYYIIADTNAGDLTCDLPTAVGRAGATYKFIKTDPANTLILNPDGTETINGNTANLEITAINQLVTLISDGTNWIATGAIWSFKTLVSSDSPYSVIQGRDRFFLVDTSSGNITINLPSSPHPQETYTFKKTATANTVIIDNLGSPLIDGLGNENMTGQWNKRVLISDGTDFFIVSEL